MLFYAARSEGGFTVNHIVGFALLYPTHYLVHDDARDGNWDVHEEYP